MGSKKNLKQNDHEIVEKKTVKEKVKKEKNTVEGEKSKYFVLINTYNLQKIRKRRRKKSKIIKVKKVLKKMKKSL